jgi:hypothetical protein
MIPGLDILLGGLTGLIGNVITGIMSYKTQKLKNEHDIAMIQAETESMKIEAQMQIQVTKAEIEGAVELADAQVYMNSQTAGNQPMFSEKWIDKLFSVEGKVGRFFAIPVAVLLAMGLGFVDWLRGFMRPALTIYLTGITTVLTYQAWDILQKHGLEGMSATQAITTYTQTTSMIIYLTVSCITWWFGDRRMAKFLTGLDKKDNRDSTDVPM